MIDCEINIQVNKLQDHGRNSKDTYLLDLPYNRTNTLNSTMNRHFTIVKYHKYNNC